MPRFYVPRLSDCTLPHDALGVSDRARMRRQSLLLKFETLRWTHDNRVFTFAEIDSAIQLNAVRERTGSGRNPMPAGVRYAMRMGAKPRR